MSTPRLNWSVFDYFIVIRTRDGDKRKPAKSRNYTVTWRQFVSLLQSGSTRSSIYQTSNTHLSKLAKKQHCYVWLSLDARWDIEWWHQFAQDWNGVAIMSPQEWNPDIVLTSDASDKWGAGPTRGIDGFNFSGLPCRSKHTSLLKNWILLYWPQQCGPVSLNGASYVQ